MRKKIAAGNWKMNTTLLQGIDLFNEISIRLNEIQLSGVQVIIAPSFVHLAKFVSLARLNNSICISAQNCSHEEKGAFTGEVSPEIIKSTGAEMVIIGHSERRKYFNESDELIEQKINLSIKTGLTPIFCCGESEIQRSQNQHFNTIKLQISKALFNLPPTDFCKVIVAYEPIWAIGTGKNATPEQAQEMHHYIRSLIEDKYGMHIAGATPILYGGSCNSENSDALFKNPDVDGGLVGGASLNAEEFIKIIRSLAAN